jgi:cell division septum initiation protein DivIVA
VVPDATQHVRDRTMSVSKRLRMISRTLRHRTGEAKTMVEAMTKEAAALVEVSLRESKRLLAQARGSRSRVIANLQACPQACDSIAGGRGCPGRT